MQHLQCFWENGNRPPLGLEETRPNETTSIIIHYYPGKTSA
jgi:hypothetical protein